MRCSASRCGWARLVWAPSASIRTNQTRFSIEQHADALVVAQIISHWVIDAQASASSETIERLLESGADFHFVVHNAAGMISVQLGVSITEALVRLRAAAFAKNRMVHDVAADVVSRRMRFQ